MLLQALAAGFRVADKLLPTRFFQVGAAEALIAAAEVEPGPDAREGLAQLLSSMAVHSELCLFGRLSLRWDIMRLLRNAQMVQAAHAARPELGLSPIKAPIFILGLPRSGTSFLHNLLALDHGNMVVRNWQTIYPSPRPDDFDQATDKRARAVNRQLRVFASFAPGFDSMHPVDADSPQECSEITAHVFQSLRFDTTHRVPSYQDWLEARGHDDALRFHKQFLQFLQDGCPRNWVLKCPDHIFMMESLLRTYPDARFIIVHRDPLAVIGSVAKLTEVLRRPFLQTIDAAEIGYQVAQRWMHGADLLLRFDRRADIAPARKCHIQYNELVAVPWEAVQRIYAQFGMTLSAAAQEAMAVHLKARPRGGYAKHAPYRLDYFRLNPASLQAGFAPYVQQYCK